MRSSGPPRNSSNPCSANGGSTNTTRVHACYALLLPSKHMPRVPYLLTFSNEETFRSLLNYKILKIYFLVSNPCL